MKIKKKLDMCQTYMSKWERQISPQNKNYTVSGEKKLGEEKS